MGKESMTKSELIDAVAQRTKITKSRAEQVVNCVFNSMTSALEQGEGIEIRGFGSFTVREYKSYSGRNPRTGRPVPVPEKRLPFFKVGKELKELVNGGVCRHRQRRRIETDDETRSAARRAQARCGRRARRIRAPRASQHGKASPNQSRVRPDATGSASRSHGAAKQDAPVSRAGARDHLHRR